MPSGRAGRGQPCLATPEPNPITTKSDCAVKRRTDLASDNQIRPHNNKKKCFQSKTRLCGLAWLPTSQIQRWGNQTWPIEPRLGYVATDLAAWPYVARRPDLAAATRSPIVAKQVP